MPGRIVLYGATGYMGARTAQAMVASGARPAVGGVRPAGALGPVEAFGPDVLERACADAGFHREHAE